jgi:hypothetical protein
LRVILFYHCCCCFVVEKRRNAWKNLNEKTVNPSFPFSVVVVVVVDKKMIIKQRCLELHNISLLINQ